MSVGSTKGGVFSTYSPWRNLVLGVWKYQKHKMATGFLLPL